MELADSDHSNSIDYHEFFNVLRTRDNPGKSQMIFDYFTSNISTVTAAQISRAKTRRRRTRSCRSRST